MMENIKTIYKSFVILFSEIIWIYYGIVMFASVEWNQPAFFDLTWFMVAAVIGYTLHALLFKQRKHVLMFLGNILALGLIILGNWRGVVPEGAWGFGIWVSIGLSIIFIRSAIVARRQPTRIEILRRFEGNSIYYIVLAIIFTVNHWDNGTFHLFFLLAIVNSLIGMMLTLQHHEDIEGNPNIKIMKVGGVGWFAGAVTMLLICIPIFSLMLLLPSVNRGLYALVMEVWERLKWIALKVYNLFQWIFSFFPDGEMEIVPGAPPDPIAIPYGDAVEETIASLSYIWIIGAVAVILIAVVIWFFTKSIVHRRGSKVMKPKYVVTSKEPWWINFKRRLKAYLAWLKFRWRRNFSYFYQESIYWYYYQILRWGRKNNCLKLQSETSQEYIKKIINKLPEEEKNFTYKEEDYYLPEVLEQFNRDYQATYYGFEGKRREEQDYKFLIKHIKGIRLNKKVP